MKVRKFIIAIIVSLVFYNVLIVNADTQNKTHYISDVSQIIGNNATIWSNVNSNDIIDISSLETTELGNIYVPETISKLTIKGSANKTYTKFNLNCKSTINVILENVNASSSTGTASFVFPTNTQCTITAVGTNSFVASSNSKCVIGNVILCGDGDLSLTSGQTTSSSNLAHCIYGNVIFDNSGNINIVSGNGKSGTSSAVNGISAGDAIYGNVECKNSGTINIKAGNGGGVYTNSSASGGKGGNGGNGGNAINGNLICSGNATITIKAGYGGYLYLRNTYCIVGTAGSGVLGNVIVKNNCNITIAGGEKRTNSDNDGFGICGDLKLYDNAKVSVNGGKGTYTSSNNGGDGAIGILGDVHLYNNAVLTCNGGDGGNGDNGNSSYASAYGNGGKGNIGIKGNVYLTGCATLNVRGGNGGEGGDYYLSSPTSGTSSGGNGATAIIGNINIGSDCTIVAKGGNGGDGGLSKTSNGGNAGSGILGDITVEGNIKFVAKPGTAGSKYYSVSSGSAGVKAYDIIVENKPVLCGGYIDAIFYDETKKVVPPIDQSGNPLYLTKIVPQLDNAFLIDKELKIISENIDYTTCTDENGYIYCYLPSNQNLVLNYGMYDATLSYVWEDNSTSMYITLGRNTNNDDKLIELTVTPNVVNGNVVFFVKANEQITTEMLHIALYSETNQMIDYIIVPTIEPFAYTNIVFKDDKTIKYAKVFLWEEMQSLTPLLGAIRVEIH